MYFVTPVDCSPLASLVHGILRQEHWSGSHSLLQGIYTTQASNRGLPHRRQILHRLSHQGSPRLHFIYKQLRYIQFWIFCDFFFFPFTQPPSKFLQLALTSRRSKPEWE